MLLQKIIQKVDQTLLKACAIAPICKGRSDHGFGFRLNKHCDCAAADSAGLAAIHALVLRSHGSRLKTVEEFDSFQLCLLSKLFHPSVEGFFAGDICVLRRLFGGVIMRACFLLNLR